MRLRIYLCMILFIISLGSHVQAQNINYSQYINAPLFTNPALLGATNEMAFSAIHRSQPLTEAINFNTTSATFLMPLMDIKQTRRLGGWGISLLNDEVKGGLDFRTQGVSAAYAYNLPIALRQYMSFGVQAGFHQRNLALQGLTTSSQWVDNAGFVSSAGIGEDLSEGRINYLSLSSGFLYYKEDELQRQIAKFGVAGYNLNRPNISLAGNNDVMPIRLTAHGSLALTEVGKVLFQGEMLFIHWNNRNTYHLGSRATYYFDNAKPFAGSIDFKVGYRVNNAITTEIQLHQRDFSLGFAYDIGVASKESYRSPNDVTEFLFVFRKFIGVNKKPAARKKAKTYTSIGKVREFYFNEAQNVSTGYNQEGKRDSAATGNESAIPEGGFKLKHDFKFGFNEAVLNDESKAYLDDMVALLKGNNAIRLEVIGHTDNVGSDDVNLRISLQRAQIVIDYLIEKGISPDKLKATGKGNKEPLVSNENKATRAINRRVEFVIYNR